MTVPKSLNSLSRALSVPKNQWLLSGLICVGLWTVALPTRSQALFPYSPKLDALQLEQQGLELADNAIQLVRFQQYDAALSRAQLAAQLAPNRFQTWFILGTLYLQQQEIDQGIQALKTALVLAPEESGILFTLGNAYFQKGDYPTAIAQLEAGLKLKPNAPSALFDLGNAYLKSNRFNEALGSYQALILILLLSGPPILVSMVLGLFVAVFQAATQIQEQTLSFTVKLFATIFTMMSSTTPGILMSSFNFEGTGGVCFMWKLMISIGVFAPWKGSVPVNISYDIMPSA